MWDEVQEEVELELSLLERLFGEHAALLAIVTDQEPDTTQILALAAILVKVSSLQSLNYSPLGGAVI